MLVVVVLSNQSVYVFADGGGRNESFGYDCGLISQLNSNFPRHFGCQWCSCDIFSLLGKSRLQFLQKHTWQYFKARGKSVASFLENLVLFWPSCARGGVCLLSRELSSWTQNDLKNENFSSLYKKVCQTEEFYLLRLRVSPFIFQKLTLCPSLFLSLQAEKKGLVMVNFFSYFLTCSNHSTIRDVIGKEIWGKWRVAGRWF